MGENSHVIARLGNCNHARSQRIRLLYYRQPAAHVYETFASLQHQSGMRILSFRVCFQNARIDYYY